MCVEEAKKIFAGDVTAVSAEILQKAAKIILSALCKAEEKISAFENEKKFLDIKNLPGEIWREVVGYEKFYQVSNFGRVKSFHQGKVRMMRPIKMSDGYCRVCFAVSKNKKSFPIHRLVASAFIPNPKNLPFINHKDGNKSNNFVENLEWVTEKENSQHAWKNGLCKKRYGAENPNAKFTEEQIKFIRENHKSHDENFGAVPLAKKFGVCADTISKIAYGKTYKNVK